MYIIVVGAGKVGESLAKTLRGRGHDIAVIEKDEGTAQKIAEDMKKALVIRGDGCDPHRLEDVKVERAKVVAAVTGDDEDNLIICQLAKQSFQVPRAIARINNPRNAPIFRQLGIDAVSSTSIIAKLIEEEASVGDMMTLLTLKKGKLVIVEVTLAEGSSAINQAIKELSIPPESMLITLVRNNEVIIPKGNTVLKKDDSIIAITAPAKEKELRKILIGKKIK